jgi:diguanylate cyclase (GGDEF)-like protein/PAS domain S-box-containing protein
MLAAAVTTTGLSLADYRIRHRALQVVLWLQLPLLIVVALLTYSGRDRVDGMAGMRMGLLPGPPLVWFMTASVAGCAIAALAIRHRRAGSLVVSMGLLLSAAALVHAGGGLTDLHFAFFVVLGLISLYQDWLALALSVALVAGHHLLMGWFAPAMLYSDPRAQAMPVRFALLHAAFVLGMCAVQLTYWHFARRSRQEKERVQAEAEQALRLRGERFQALVQDSCDVITLLDREGRITSVSQAAQQVMGYPPDELAGVSYYSLIHPDDHPSFTANGHYPDEYRAEMRTRHADGAWHWHEVTMRNLADHPAVGGVVVNHRDISERRMFQERLMHEASHDNLTGLINRAEFLRVLDDIVKTADHRAPRVAVLYVDLDRFKQVNDTYGHEAGDGLLVAAADTLRRCVLGSDTVGRLGGDEFAVILSNIDAAGDAVAVAQRIHTELTRPVIVNRQQVTAGASIGIALAQPGCLDTDRLLHQADTAMYQAKRREGAGWEVFVAGMQGEDGGTQSLVDELARAIPDGQLRLQYQPIVTLETGALVGVEALVRWHHPTRGMLPPAMFIPLAEQSDLIHQIGLWALREGCAQVQRWRRQMPAGQHLGLNVNLSPYQLNVPNLTSSVADVLGAVGYDAADLTLELTESALINYDAAVPHLRALHELGIRIALDDFGTGYSSLRYLSQLPVDVLKIDRCFVAELDGTQQGGAVAEAVLRLGEILHLDVVAEGIETTSQAAELALLGCRKGQGYLFARPLDADLIDGLLRECGPQGPRLTALPVAVA